MNDKPRIIRPQIVAEELPFKYYESGELIATFRNEEDLELFKAQMQLNGNGLHDCLDDIESNY